MVNFLRKTFGVTPSPFRSRRRTPRVGMRGEDKRGRKKMDGG